MPRGSVRKRHGPGCPARSPGGRCRCEGTWQIRFRDRLGQRLERGGFATRQAAESALQDAFTAVERGGFAEVAAIGFADFAARWIETYARPNTKASTCRDYEGSIRNHLAPYFGNVELRQISREMVQRYLADKVGARKRDGTPAWKPKTINGTLVPLREMLGHAVEWGYLASNPAAMVKPLRLEPAEREILTPEELAAALEVAEGKYALIFRMAALLGLRRGELLGLRWDDLELDRRRLHVRQTYTNTGFGSPKSRAGRRVVPVTPGLVRELRKHRISAPPNEHGLVFASSAGTPIDPRNLVTAWHRALRRAGVRALAFHSLRHTAVSLMIAHEGLNPKQLSAVIGHASIQLTYDTYGHLMPDSFEGFGERLDALSDPASEDGSRAAWGHGGVTAANLANAAEVAT